MGVIRRRSRQRSEIRVVRIEWFLIFVAMDIELHKLYVAYVEMPLPV